jgi:ligand-binding sensor domain-containing protein
MFLGATMTRPAYSTYLFLVGIFALRIAAAAEHHPPSFVQFTRSNGLASNIVAGVAKDARGFLWIATPDGMQRFDGTTFQTFRYTPSEAKVFRGVNYLSCFAMDSNCILFFEFSGRIDQYNYRTGLVENYSHRAGLDTIEAVSAFQRFPRPSLDRNTKRCGAHG